jgi:uncharacterized protein (TIRG00374 family)
LPPDPPRRPRKPPHNNGRSALEQHETKRDVAGQPAWRRRLALLLRLLITASLLVFILTLVDVRELAGLVGSADIVWLLATLLVAAGDRLLMVVKWFPLLKIQNVAVPFGRAARAYLASGVAHYFLPASVGADVLRATVLGRAGRFIIEVGASIVAERALGLVASALMSMVSLAIAVRLGLPVELIFPWALFSVAAGAAILILPLNRSVLRGVRNARILNRIGRARRYVERFADTYTIYRSRVGILVGMGWLTVLEQLFPIAILWLLGRALGVPLSLTAVLVAVPLTLFVIRLPISFGGLGVGEGALVYLLGLFGVSPTEALTLALSTRVVEVLVNAGPSVFLWRELVSVKRLRPQPS